MRGNRKSPGNFRKKPEIPLFSLRKKCGFFRSDAMIQSIKWKNVDEFSSLFGGIFREISEKKKKTRFFWFFFSGKKSEIRTIFTWISLNFHLAYKRFQSVKYKIVWKSPRKIPQEISGFFSGNSGIFFSGNSPKFLRKLPDFYEVYKSLQVGNIEKGPFFPKKKKEKKGKKKKWHFRGKKFPEFPLFGKSGNFGKFGGIRDEFTTFFNKIYNFV